MQHYLNKPLAKQLPPVTKLPRLFPQTRTLVVVSAATTTDRRRKPETMYELLAVTETAAPEEIKSAYRRQALRWHPDACRTSEEKEFFAQEFMRAHEAYRVLSDPVLRNDYDWELRNGGGGNGVVYGKMRRGSGDGGGYGDWEAQLEGLQMRSRSRSSFSAATSWGSRMRSDRRSTPLEF